LRTTAGLDAGKIFLGGGQQILTLVGAFGGDIGVAAGNQPLPGKLGGGDTGRVELIEQGHLQRPALQQRLDRWSAQCADQVETRGSDIAGDARLRDHAAVTDHTT
jgi:hypothetical protein